MIVIIDGYNVLKQIFPHIKGKLEPQRDMFIRQLGHYQHKKASSIKSVIAVFDAGPFGHASREVKHGVVVMFSGQRSSADDWIIEYVQEHPNEELLVVTNDRKIISASMANNATTLGSNDFYQILQKVLYEEKSIESGPEIELSADIKKFEKYEYPENDLFAKSNFDEKCFDALMEESSLIPQKKDDIIDELGNDKAKQMKLSKKERRLYSKLKKLY